MQPIFHQLSIIINLIKQPVCNEAYRLLGFYNSNESSASTHICKLPSRYNLAYSSGSSTASEVNAQSDPGVVFKFFSASQQSNGKVNFEQTKNPDVEFFRFSAHFPLDKIFIWVYSMLVTKV